MKQTAANKTSNHLDTDGVSQSFLKKSRSNKKSVHDRLRVVRTEQQLTRAEAVAEAIKRTG